MANSVDPDQTAPIGAVCSGSSLFASILYSSVMLGNYLQQTTSADDIFRCIFFLALKGLNIQHICICLMTTYKCKENINLIIFTTERQKRVVFIKTINKH